MHSLLFIKKGIGYGIRHIAYFCLSLFLLLMGGCTGITPSAAAKNLAECIKTGDYAKASENMTAQSDSTDKRLFMEYLRRKREVDFAKQGGIVHYKVIDEAVTPDESKAIVRIRYTFRDHSTMDELITLIKSDGSWKYSLLD